MNIDVFCDESRPDLFATQRNTLGRFMLIGSYLVVLQFRGKARNWAKFITAFPHDTPDRIRHDPNKRRVWPKKKE